MDKGYTFIGLIFMYIQRAKETCQPYKTILDPPLSDPKDKYSHKMQSNRFDVAGHNVKKEEL